MDSIQDGHRLASEAPLGFAEHECWRMLLNDREYSNNSDRECWRMPPVNLEYKENWEYSQKNGNIQVPNGDQPWLLTAHG